MHYEKLPDGSVKCIENEIPFELPQGWEWCRLFQISEIVTGSTPNKKNPQYYGNVFPFFKPSDLEQGANVVYSSEYLSDEGRKVCRVIPVGSTAVCCIGSIGKCGYLLREGTTNQQINSVIPYVEKKYAFYYCSTNFFVEQLLLKASSTTIAIVNKNKMSNVFIPIPPLSEQKRIANRLDLLIKCVDKINIEKESLSKIIQLAKSKILDLAIRGKLIPQDPNDEPASVLLEHIRAEKEELIKQGKIKRDKKESVIFRGEDNSYYLRTGSLTETLDDWKIDDIPNSWDVCCLGEVCDYGNCTNVDTKDIPETAWILDLEDIEKDTGKILQKLTLKERNSASTKHLFHKGQILYSKLRPYLNKVVLADDDGFCTSEILSLNFNGYILPEYAKCYMMSPTFLRYANHCSYGVKMPRLGTLDGKKAVLTMPPINEQKRIADKVSQLFSLLDSIAENIN